jgi:hypothetical protein
MRFSEKKNRQIGLNKMFSIFSIYEQKCDVEKYGGFYTTDVHCYSMCTNPQSTIA